MGKWDSHWVAANDTVTVTPDGFQPSGVSPVLPEKVPMHPEAVLSEALDTTQGSFELPSASVSVFEHEFASAAELRVKAREPIVLELGSGRLADISANERVVQEERPHSPEAFRSDRRWRPVAMAVSMALHEVHRQRRLEQGTGVAATRLGCLQSEVDAKALPCGPSFFNDRLLRV